MTGVDSAVEVLRAAAGEVLPSEPVLWAYLFGSRARGTARPDSDADVAVVLSPDVAPTDRLEVQLRLARRLTRSPGLTDIDLVVLDGAPLPLRGRVVQEGRVVYSVDEGARIAYDSRTAREFYDYSIWIAPFDAEMLLRHASGTR